MFTSRLLARTAPAICLLAMLTFAAGAARADSLTFDFLPTSTFSGTAPAGTLTVNFLQVAGGVQLTITSNLASGENLDPNKALYLNFDPSLDATKLNFTLQSSTGGFSQAATVQTANALLSNTNGFKADGDGYDDILFGYTSSTKAFTNGESQTYLITDSATTLAASDFNFSSVRSATGYLAAIHVQNTPSGASGSGWVAGTLETPPPPPPPPSSVPEPGSLVLMGTGLVGLSAMVRRLKK